ncbi:MAG: hypothetical protein HYU41_22805 [Candidatus Rokubacteria bacterium]|nr:hypothetical protein [Candidatus Rokubacteria bacterium]
MNVVIVRGVTVAVVIALMATPASAQTLFAPSTVGEALSRSAIATPTGRGTNPNADLSQRVQSMPLTPVAPSSPGAAVAMRPDMMWVPDRYVPVPGAPQGVLVPGHWEQRLSDRSVSVPTLTIVHPAGESSVIPAGVRPPADQRIGP